MRIFEMNCGTGRPLGCRLIAAMPREMVCRCLLLATDDQLVLIDTGFGREDVRTPTRRLGIVGRSLGLTLREHETAHAQIERLGLDTKAVGHIVMTHLDLDHAGGLSDFPNAQVHVFGEELRAAKRRKKIGERLRYRTSQWNKSTNWMQYTAMEPASWFGFSSASVCIPGFSIRLVHLPGHTRGHCGIAIQSPSSAWIFHVGDSYYSTLEIDPAHDSFVLNAFRRSVHVQPRIAARTLDSLRQLRETTTHREIQMLCSHDPREGVRDVPEFSSMHARECARA